MAEHEYVVSNQGVIGGLWATYRRVPYGLRRVGSLKLPLRKTKEEAEHDLAVWLAERAPMNRQSRARRALRLVKRAWIALRDSKMAIQPGVVLAYRHKGQDLAQEAWRELEAGLGEPYHPDQPIEELDIEALAGMLEMLERRPANVREVLEAYGQYGRGEAQIWGRRG